MARKGLSFLWFATIIFSISSVILVWHFFHQKNYTIHCSGNITIFHDNASLPFLRGKLSLSLESDGKGHIRMDGESTSVNGATTLHRFIFFKYHSQHSPGGKDYIFEEYRIVLTPADNSGDEAFLRLVNTISQGAQKLRIRIREINPGTMLISSVNSPLLVCTSQ